jgi:hypothetical protein
MQQVSNIDNYRRGARMTRQALISDGSIQPIYLGGKWSPETRAGKYFIVWNNAGSLNEVGAFIVPNGIGGTFAVALTLPAGVYSLDTSGMPGTIGVYSGIFAQSGDGDGWSAGSPDAVLTANAAPMGAP